MFQWLFRRRAGFRLPCGTYCDPLKAYRKLLVADIDSWLDKSASPDPSVYDAAETRVCEIARDALGLDEFQPRTGSGHTDEQVLESLDAFLGYCKKKGWKAKRGQIPLPPTEFLGLSVRKNN